MNYQNFQIQDLYYPFQVPPQQEEPTGSDESMKNLIQAENYVTHSINKIEAQMNHLIKDGDEELYLTHF